MTKVRAVYRLADGRLVCIDRGRNLVLVGDSWVPAKDVTIITMGDTKNARRLTEEEVRLLVETDILPKKTGVG